MITPRKEWLRVSFYIVWSFYQYSLFSATGEKTRQPLA